MSQLQNKERLTTKQPCGCKYCGQEHPNIGMTIIPSCVDAKIATLEKQIEALKKPVTYYDVWCRLPERIRKRISADDCMTLRDITNDLKCDVPSQTKAAFVPVGINGMRDPDNICEAFNRRKRTEADRGRCEGDGHYMCKECCLFTGDHL